MQRLAVEFPRNLRQQRIPMVAIGDDDAAVQASFGRLGAIGTSERYSPMIARGFDARDRGA
jgi:hypothetical protein